jgi:hypothetical protein
MKTGYILALILSSSPLLGQISVTTAQYNISRTSANQSETVLNTSNLNAAQFGLLYSRQVDGQLYAQPLYLANASIQGKTQNVIYLATMHNSVYAFAADDAGASAPLWQVNLGTPASFNFPELQPECGILSTPVIDAVSHTLYVVALTQEGGNRVFRLHALDTANGAEKFNGPAVIKASVRGSGFDSQAGVVTFSPANQLQRPALLLFANSVFIAFGTASPQEPVRQYHGWLLAYDAKTLLQKFAFNTTPNGGAGGIWMSGAGPSADTNGFYFATGNGTLGQGGTSQGVIRIGGTTGDFFIPDNWQTLNTNDWDLGSTGVMLLPGTSLLVAGGKTGTVYVLSRTNLGHLTTGNTQAAQVLQATAGCSSSGCNEIHHFTYWYRGALPPLLYVWGWKEPLKVFALVNGQFSNTPIAQNSLLPNYPGGILALSANGAVPGSGVLWAVTSTENATLATVPGVLHAFDAANVATELWNSKMNPGDDLGTMAKFNVPTVANGKVFVATFSNQLMVYGLH